MSFTQTCTLPPEACTSQLRTTRKRKCLSPEPSLSSAETTRPKDQAPSRQQVLHSQVLECRQNTKHSSLELYRWTFNYASVAPVRAKHVFEMDRDENNCGEIYWMGRVPCRTVKVVGIVVGIDEFDDMTRFKLDDGTAVIDCDFKHPRMPKPPSTPTAKPTTTALSKYAPPGSSKPSLQRQDQSSGRFQVPKVNLGSLVSVQGRIFQGRGTRCLRVETGSFSICNSANDEPRHWMEVNRLCREHYYLPEPFVIPTIDQRPESTDEPTPNAPNPAAQSSPTSVSSPSGTECSRSSTASPRHPRLRHPSRLRSRDLTDVTFRIYVKHFMDFAPPYCPTQRPLSEGNDEPAYFNDPFATPTPKSRYKTCYPSSPPSTPTPKPRRQAQPSKVAEDENSIQYGFTLSYLRRVPVLAEMARAVVLAEGKRREREKRKREKRDQQRSQTAHTQGSDCNRAETSSSRSTSKLSDPQLVSRNMKHLFQKTIRDLYRDGSIIIWNGPARPCEHAFHADGTSLGDSSSLWKTSSKGTSLPSTASTTTTLSTYDYSTENETLEGYLSDPDENEESYLPVTARTIAPYVVRALRTLTGVNSSDARLRKKRQRPTADEVTSYLQKSDAQWANIGSWDVQASLEWLQSEDYVFKAGESWALSGS